MIFTRITLTFLAEVSLRCQQFDSYRSCNFKQGTTWKLRSHKFSHFNSVSFTCHLFPRIGICHLLALLGAHHILHVSRIRVNSTGPMTVPARISDFNKTTQNQWNTKLQILTGHNFINWRNLHTDICATIRFGSMWYLQVVRVVQGCYVDSSDTGCADVSEGRTSKSLTSISTWTLFETPCSVLTGCTAHSQQQTATLKIREKKQHRTQHMQQDKVN